MAFPTLATTFAEASRALGFRPLYAEDGANRALVLMRGLSAPVIGPWTRRAKVNVESTDVGFATELVKVIRRSSPALVRWGDHYWPPAPAVLDECPGMRPVVRHIIEQDLTRDEDRSEEHTSELHSPYDHVCRLLLEKKKSNRLKPTQEILNLRSTKTTVEGGLP